MAITITGGLTFSGGMSLASPAGLLTGSTVLNGSSQYLTVASPPANLRAWSTGSFTVEYWVNPTAFSQGGNGESTVIGNMAAGSTGTYWGFGPVTGGTVRFYYYNGAPASFSTSVVIQTNVWTHLAFVNNAGALTIYVNGISSATSTISGTPITGADIPLTIGSSNSVRFSGSITNVRITGSAVYTANFVPSTTPLAAIANTSLLLSASTAGTLVTDSSTNNYTVTNNGTATWSSTSPFTTYPGSAVFTGAAGQYLRLAGQTQFAMGTGDFTIEAWFNVTGFSLYPTIIDFRPLSTNGAYPCLYIDNTGAMIYMVSSTSVITKSGMSLNTWTHVAIVRASSVTKMYINGVYTGTSYNDTNNYSVGASRPIIGQVAYAENGGLPGNITNLRVVKGTAVYTSNFTPSTIPLTNITNTSLLLLETSALGLLTDSSTNNFTVTNAGSVAWSYSTPFVS